MIGGPYYVLFAGVNGAGKSTLYRSGMWQHGEINDALPRVNADEILSSHGWNWEDQSAQLRAGREALALMQGHFKGRESFNQETTLTGKGILRWIRYARELGYHVVLYFIGLEDPAIANERIKHRIALGGHSVAPERVELRHRRSLDNFAAIADICNEAYLFDNTSLLRLCVRFEFGELAFYSETLPQPQWVKTLLANMGFQEIPFPWLL